MIKLNCLYQHYKGGFYKTLIPFINEADGESHILYQNIESKKTFGRPIKEFEEDVELTLEDGISISSFTIKRFAEVEQ